MSFLGIANGASNEIEQVTLPEVSPAVQGEQIHGGCAEAVDADGGEHIRASGIPAVQGVVAVALALTRPIEFGCWACKTIENGAIAGGHFLENAADEGVGGWRGEF